MNDINKSNVEELVNLLRLHDISKIVICPGSRNIPLITAFANNPAFECHPVTDERSAGFFALGLALHGGHKVAICCTSGTALVNLHSAIAEAHYQEIPLIVISADRPRAWLNQMDGQVIPQENIFTHLAKYSINIKPSHTQEEIWYVNRMINEAILASEKHGKGPVHINIEIAEPINTYVLEDAPKRVLTYYQGLNIYDRDYSIIFDTINKFPRKMMLIGQMSMIYEFEKRDAKQLYKHFVWLGEHLANQTAPGLILRNFDLAIHSLTEETQAKLSPDLLITFGGHIISKRIKTMLEKNPPKEHWHISKDGKIMDRYKCLTRVIEIDPFEFMEKIAPHINAPTPSYPRLWEKVCSNLPKVEFEYSQMQVIGEIIGSLPTPSSLHLGNSSSIRYAQLFTLDSSIEVCGNRGANGIDGSLSTALGYAYHSDNINFIIIGDLSFFYDMNILNTALIRNNVRILLINNYEGEIFHTLPHIEINEINEQFITAKHNRNAEAWAKSRDFDYRSVNNSEEFNDARVWFTQSEISSSPLFLEVFTDTKQDVELLRKYFRSIKKTQ